MAYQLNFTEITFGTDAGGSFGSAPTRLPGSTRATFFQRPRQVIRRKCPDGSKDIERPIQPAYGLTWEGEFYPGLAWTSILSQWFQFSAVSGSGTAYSPTDAAPVEFYMEAELEGGNELYSFNNCVLASLSIQWQSSAVPVFRAEWLVRSRGAPEELTAPTVNEATPGSTVGAPALTNAYMRRAATAWGADPPTAYKMEAQAFQIILTRDYRHAQFNRLGTPTKWGWSNGLDVAGRIQSIASFSDIANLSASTDTGLLRIEMPTVLDGAAGFYFDIILAQMSIINMPLLSDGWASRVIEFVNIKDATGHTITFYDGQTAV